MLRIGFRREAMVQVNAHHSEPLFLAAVRELNATEHMVASERGVLVQQGDQTINIVLVYGLRNFHLRHCEEIHPASLGSTIVQSVPDQPEIWQLLDGSDVRRGQVPRTFLFKEARSQDVSLGVRLREARQEMGLHVMHGLTIVQQLINDHNLVRLLRARVAELPTLHIGGDRQRLALRALVAVGGCLRKEDGVGARQRATEVREEHESALQNGNDHDALSLAPRFDAVRGNTNTRFNLLTRENQSVMFQILEVLGSCERRLVVAISQRSQELLRADLGRLEHGPLPAGNGCPFGQDCTKHTLHKRRYR
mmetsp:Transcript_34016/g.90627  ORF Transcript_34016/g.90627 Transcript_34016/m.90627 type:complete len:308 (-) Transcript_34016:322-1245(-)